MTGLTSVRIQHVRNLQNVQLQPGPGINVVVGENGCGKTSFLEALYLLGRAKSFRTQTVSKLIATGQKQLLVHGRVKQASGVHTSIGVQKSTQDTELRINGQACKRVSDLVACLPLLLIRPESHQLIDGIPLVRRSYLDWGLFHVKPNFLPGYKRYQRALNQRNVLLRKGKRNELKAWSQELHESGLFLAAARTEYLSEIKTSFKQIAQVFPALSHVDLTHSIGWDEKRPLIEVLEASIEQDIERGYTWYGPHRSDLLIKSEGVLAKDRLSRGQIKLLIICLNLAQLEVLQHQNGWTASVLIDDLVAELDQNHLQLALTHLGEMGAQTFITTTNLDLIPLDVGQNETKVFHVKQGVFQ